MTLSPQAIAIVASLAAALAFHLVFGALSRLVPSYRRRFKDTMSAQLSNAYLFVDPSRLLRVNLGAALLASTATAVLMGSIAWALVAALACGALPRVVLAVIRKRRREAFRRQLSDLMLLTAGGLRAGLSLAQSLEQSSGEIEAPARQEIGLMMREQRLGASFEEALGGLEQRMPIEETALFTAALRISRETGGNLAETMESLADALRRKVAIEGKIAALTAQGRLQGWAMGLLPVGSGALLWLVEPTAMSALFQTWYGLCTCACVLVMQSLGLYFVRRVMRIDV